MLRLIRVFLNYNLLHVIFGKVKKKSYSDRYEKLRKGCRIPLLSLNEHGEKSRATIILDNFVNKSLSNSYCRIVFGKCFSLQGFFQAFCTTDKRCWSKFKASLVFFLLILVDIFCFKKHSQF